MAFFEAIPGILEGFGGTILPDTVSYANFDSTVNLEISLGVSSGSFRHYDNEDSVAFVSQTFIWTLERTDTGLLIDNVIGGAGGDRIVGNEGANILVGLDAAQDASTGAGGAADFSPGPTLGGSGRSSPGLGHNRLEGNGGDDMLIGDMGIGDGARDYLLGGTGEDTLDAGIGHNDELSGGANSDVFIFNDSTGQYRIMDYEDGMDMIVIAGEPGLSFVGLNITQDGANAEVAFGDTTIVFQNTNTAELGLFDFVFL